VAPVLVESMTDRERLELLLEAYDHLNLCHKCLTEAFRCDIGDRYDDLVDAVRMYLAFTKTGAVTGETQESIPEGSGWPPVE